MSVNLSQFNTNTVNLEAYASQHFFTTLVGSSTTDLIDYFKNRANWLCDEIIPVLRNQINDLKNKLKEHEKRIVQNIKDLYQKIGLRKMPDNMYDILKILTGSFSKMTAVAPGVYSFKDADSLISNLEKLPYVSKKRRTFVDKKHANKNYVAFHRFLKENEALFGKYDKRMQARMDKILQPSDDDELIYYTNIDGIMKGVAGEFINQMAKSLISSTKGSIVVEGHAGAAEKLSDQAARDQLLTILFGESDIKTLLTNQNFKPDHIITFTLDGLLSIPINIQDKLSKRLAHIPGKTDPEYTSTYYSNISKTAPYSYNVSAFGIDQNLMTQLSHTLIQGMLVTGVKDMKLSESITQKLGAVYSIPYFVMEMLGYLIDPDDNNNHIFDVRTMPIAIRGYNGYVLVSDILQSLLQKRLKTVSQITKLWTQSRFDALFSSNSFAGISTMIQKDKDTKKTVTTTSIAQYKRSFLSEDRHFTAQQLDARNSLLTMQDLSLNEQHLLKIDNSTIQNIIKHRLLPIKNTFIYAYIGYLNKDQIIPV